MFSLQISFQYQQFWIWIQIWKGQNQKFEREFKICERNKSKISHRQNEWNWTKYFVILPFCTVWETNPGALCCFHLFSLTLLLSHRTSPSFSIVYYCGILFITVGFCTRFKSFATFQRILSNFAHVSVHNSLKMGGR